MKTLTCIVLHLHCIRHKYVNKYYDFYYKIYKKIDIITFFLYNVKCKMKIIVFDTETTGLPEGNNPSIRETKKWPYMVQLSYIVYDTDYDMLVECIDEIIKIPERITISEESISLHGISKDISRQKGKQIKNVLNEFNKHLLEADIVVGHNISFDKRIIMVESIRNYMRQYFTRNGIRKQEYCTMKNSVELCKIEAISRKGEKYLKYPNLGELYNKLFDSKPKNVHNSMIDVILCLRCYCKMEFDKDIYEVGCEKTKELFNMLTY